MRTVFYTRNVELNDSQRQHIASRFRKLNRYLAHLEKYTDNPDNVVLEIHIDKQRNMYDVKVRFNLYGNEIIMRDGAPNLMDAINSLVDALWVKLARYKDKYVSLTRKTISLREMGLPEQSNQVSTANVEVIHRRYNVPILSEDRAIRIMLRDNELKYLVFYNRDADKMCIIERLGDNTLAIAELVW